MRADALQRRRRILHEARQLFSAHGSDISLESIAEASDVGIATLYRNFASRDALITEVTLDIVSDIEAALDEAGDAIEDSPSDAWNALVHRLVELNLGALTDALGGSDSSEISSTVAEAQRSVLVRFDAVLHDLAKAGAIKHSLTAIEVVVAVGILTRPQRPPIQQATPHLVEHLIEAFLQWSRP